MDNQTQQTTWKTWDSGSTPWHLVGHSADGLTVFVQYATHLEAAGAQELEDRLPTLRDRLDAVDVLETDESVTITLRQTIQASAETVGVVEAHVVVGVRLASPLGERRLRHGAIDDAMGEFDSGPSDLYVEIDGPGPGACGPRPWSQPG